MNEGGIQCTIKILSKDWQNVSPSWTLKLWFSVYELKSAM